MWKTAQALTPLLWGLYYLGVQEVCEIGFHLPMMLLLQHHRKLL
jgi:hypothetical protein